MFKHGYAPSRLTHLTNPVLQVQQGQCNPSMYIQQILLNKYMERNLFIVEKYQHLI